MNGSFEADPAGLRALAANLFDPLAGLDPDWLGPAGRGSDEGHAHAQRSDEQGEPNAPGRAADRLHLPPSTQSASGRPKNVTVYLTVMVSRFTLERVETTYKLDELARAAGTSPRTVRYYVQRGLLPGPTFRGKDSAYGREHLVRLRAIRRLQDAFFPLDAIAVELDRRSLEEIERIADGRDLPATLAEPPPNVGQILPGPPSSAGSGGTARLFRRIEIAPGVELSVAADAPASSQAMVEKILQSFGRA
jgi:DNA-binding transcriptional MerR regulator